MIRPGLFDYNIPGVVCPMDISFASHDVFEPFGQGLFIPTIPPLEQRNNESPIRFNEELTVKGNQGMSLIPSTDKVEKYSSPWI